MKRNVFIILIVIFVHLSTVILSDKLGSDNAQDVFVATKEWQVVKKGQKIPKGLHIRMNLETGQTEAKLLEDTDDRSKALTETQNSKEDEERALKFSEEELKEALKNIKNEDNPQVELQRKIENKFRSYEELKKDLHELNLVPKTDAELLRELIKKYQKVSKARELDELHILAILEDMEFLVHQFDNANEFVSLNGFNEVIYKNLNSSNAQIKRESLKLLGSSVQNNAKVQIHALETGSIGFLLRVLALDSDYGVKNRAVFALGGLMRRFPLAQQKFIENAGLSVFTELLDKSVDIKLLLKIITLVNDLILEHKYTLEDKNSSNHIEKIRQYNQVDLKKRLVKQDWCHYLSELLKTLFEVDNENYDGIENCLNAILSILDVCDAQQGVIIKNLVFKLHTQYKTLSLFDNSEHNDSEMDSSYYNHLLELCVQITTHLNNKYKTEL